MQRIRFSLAQHSVSCGLDNPEILRSARTSAVLFLLGMPSAASPQFHLPGLILTKRSETVRQPGDLCCPGGSVAPLLDPWLAKLLFLPGSPLNVWPEWPAWRRRRRLEATTLAGLFATGLRESFEEMRLNPLRVRLLGLLPAEKLISFDRQIYPLVCWVDGQRRFLKNREVEKVIFIPLRDLLNPENYACYRLRMMAAGRPPQKVPLRDFPCFVFRQAGQTECLWGATYRLTQTFLRIVFGFVPPPVETLPVIAGRLDKNYLTGVR